MARPSISLRTSAGLLSGYVSVMWRKAERTMLIRAWRTSRIPSDADAPVG